MTPLRKRMLEELQLRNLSENTVTAYVGAVRRFAQYFGRSPEKLGPDQVRQYLLYLLNEKKDNHNTIQVYRGALRFLYVRVLKQSWFEEQIPVPKKRRRLPTVLTPQEIACILDHTINLKHWMIIATLYATALRCDELRHLKVSDIDSQRMILHIRKAKGSLQRDIALSPACWNVCGSTTAGVSQRIGYFHQHSTRIIPSLTTRSANYAAKRGRELENVSCIHTYSARLRHSYARCRRRPAYHSDFAWPCQT
jgi:site-specific recombinase XerD